MSPTTAIAEFSHAEKGMTRFPPNIEQITIEHETTRTWLICRRNDIVLRFPLNESDCRHLAALLMDLPVSPAISGKEPPRGSSRGESA
jgi:hypothetical protein